MEEGGQRTHPSSPREPTSGKGKPKLLNLEGACPLVQLVLLVAILANLDKAHWCSKGNDISSSVGHFRLCL
jgi:hypothetical protein